MPDPTEISAAKTYLESLRAEYEQNGFRPVGVAALAILMADYAAELEEKLAAYDDWREI